MGCEDRICCTDDPNEVPFWELPNTPPAGAATSKAPDGITELIILDWKADIMAPRNDEFFNAVIELVQRTGSEGESAQAQCTANSYSRWIYCRTVLDAEKHTSKRLVTSRAATTPISGTSFQLPGLAPFTGTYLISGT